MYCRGSGQPFNIETQSGFCLLWVCMMGSFVDNSSGDGQDGAMVQ